MAYPLKIKLVSVESGISAIGFRKIAAVARQADPAAEICFIPVDNLYSFASHFFPDKDTAIKEKDFAAAAAFLSSADVVAFSSMTASAPYVEKISAELKRIKPAIFILWGGVHPILHPDESLAIADAICTGEGEVPMKSFMESLQKGTVDDDVAGMWFKKNGQVKKNARLPLNSPQLLSSLPHSYQKKDCVIYDATRKEFRPVDKLDYVTYNGLGFRTLWVMGCPFNCAYCANDSFIQMDPGHRKLRHPTVDYIMDEIAAARAEHPYISSIGFYDDNFIALRGKLLEEFCEKYKSRVNLPFGIFGMHPNLTSKEKVEMLTKAGMNRTRMGIQSGSEATLRFYNRPTPVARIKESAAILASAAREYNMIPPGYDIISDNKAETIEDGILTLKLLYELERPFTLTVFSLRVFPRTQLFEHVQAHPLLLAFFKGNSYLDTAKTLNNITLYLLGTFKPPRLIFESLVSGIRKEGDKPRDHPALYFLAKALYLSKRGLDHLLRFDFSNMAGKWTYYLWKIRDCLRRGEAR